MTRKAYMVTEPYEGHSVIVFAKQSVVARRNGANELNIEFGDVEGCVRKPHFDHYAEAGEVPVQALLADGWWFECSHCGHRLTELGREEDETQEPIEDSPYIYKRLAYCDIDCFAADRAEHIDRQRRIQALLDAANERFPGVTAMASNDYIDNRSVWFRFPGGCQSVMWDLAKGYLSMAPADIPAWEAFTGKPIEIEKNERT